MKKFLSLIFSLIILSSAVVIPANAENSSGTDLQGIYSTIDSVIAWKNAEDASSSSVINSDLIQNAGTSVFDWFAFSSGRMGRDEDYSSYISALESYVNSGSTEVLTDYQRISLAYLACGGDASKINLLDKAVFDSLNNDNLSEKPVNSLMYALLVLDSERYEIPEGTNLTRSAIITQIFCNRLENGAFALSGNTPDTDVTCIAIQALAPYYNSSEKFTYMQGDTEQTVTVREVVDSAVEYLSSIQLDDGDMPTWGNATSESTAQTVVALCSLGIDPSADERFVKSGNSLINGLLKYYMSDGGFAHTLTDGEGESNTLASVEAFYALVAYCRYENGYRSLFDMREEPSDEVYADIGSLINGIENLESDDTAAAKALLDDYAKIPLSERSYVYNFYILSDILNSNGIENTADYTADEIGTEKSGSGAIVDITVAKNTAEKSSDSLGELDSTYSKLEASSAAPQSRNNLGTMGTVAVIAIGVGAVAVIVLNHKLNPKNNR